MSKGSVSRIVVKEHTAIAEGLGEESELWNSYDPILKGGLCLSHDASPFNQKFFIEWSSVRNRYTPSTYRSSFIIGVQRFATEFCENVEVVVLPKIECLDFLKMFMTCFLESRNNDSFSDVYGIDYDAPYINVAGLSNVLSPLLIVRFLSLMKRLLSKGLRKSYVKLEDNRYKIKGRVNISNNQKYNVSKKKYHKFYCEFQEFSIDTLENRLLKKALICIAKYLRKSQENTAKELIGVVQQYISLMNGVGLSISYRDIKQIRANKIYQEYKALIPMAKLILKYMDDNMLKENVVDTIEVPPFWIDMSLLFERYVYAWLNKAYPNDIIYQYQGYTGYPDFLSLSTKSILDAKYIISIDNSVDTYIIRQLSGYARDQKILDCLGVSGRENPIPCVLVYPSFDRGGAIENPFQGCLKSIYEENPISNYVGFYKIAISVPLISEKSF